MFCFFVGFDRRVGVLYHIFITPGISGVFYLEGLICMKKVINSNNAPKAIGPYSQAIEDGGFVFTSGVLPIDPVTGEIYNGSVRVQTELILKNLENILKEKGFKVVTQVLALETFWPAEEYHQHYYVKKGSAPYCHRRVKRI